MDKIFICHVFDEIPKQVQYQESSVEKFSFENMMHGIFMQKYDK